MSRNKMNNLAGKVLKRKPYNPANTKRWTNIKPALGQRLVFAWKLSFW